MNVLCLGGRTTFVAVAWDLVSAFLNANFSGAERHRRRLAKAAKLEEGTMPFKTNNQPQLAGATEDRRPQ